MVKKHCWKTDLQPFSVKDPTVTILVLTGKISKIAYVIREKLSVHKLFMDKTQDTITVHYILYI